MTRRARGVAHVNQTSKTIPLPDVESVVVALDLTDSDLELSGGADSLMEADFYYDEREREAPSVEFTQKEDRGNLTVQDVPPRRRRYRSHVTENRWVIQLNQSLPLDSRVGSASGDCVLDCDDTILSHLYVATSSGDLDIGLSNSQPQLGDVDVVSSSGDIRFDASGEFPALSKLGYRSSSGDMKLNLSGTFAALQAADFHHTSGDLSAKFTGMFHKPLSLTLRNTSGDITLDLSGTWQADVKATIQINSGDVKLRLPNDVGVMVTAATTSGDIQAKGFKRHAGGWVNSIYGDASVNLTIKVTALSGDIRLRLAN